MRLDKYLKVSRLIKRRTVASAACDGDRVEVNGKKAKPSHNIKMGDVIEIRFGARKTRIQVVSLSEHAAKNAASAMYRELTIEGS
ncbi:MAG: RNA-binding S4 domain-containing protein [Oscillospiraceae bacterium]|nr:RNA-binding S4 domain-containing protein [Oscillospiraceae bacterium]